MIFIGHGEIIVGISSECAGTFKTDRLVEDHYTVGGEREGVVDLIPSFHYGNRLNKLSTYAESCIEG